MSHTRPRPASESRRRLLEIGVTVALLLVVAAALPGAYSLFQRYQRTSRVVFSGIGVQLEPVPAEDGSVRVAAVMPYATPDVQAAIRAGDRITHVDGTDVRRSGIDQTVRRIRGPIGTTVRLTLRRKGSRDPLDVIVTRRAIRAGQLGEDGE